MFAFFGIRFHKIEPESESFSKGGDKKGFFVAKSPFGVKGERVPPPTKKEHRKQKRQSTEKTSFFHLNTIFLLLLQRESPTRWFGRLTPPPFEKGGVHVTFKDETNQRKKEHRFPPHPCKKGYPPKQGLWRWQEKFIQISPNPP